MSDDDIGTDPAGLADPYTMTIMTMGVCGGFAGAAGLLLAAGFLGLPIGIYNLATLLVIGLIGIVLTPSIVRRSTPTEPEDVTEDTA